MKVIEFSDDDELLKEIGVDLFVFFPVRGQLDIGENRADGTNRLAHSAINALVGVDEHLRRLFVGLDAVARANLRARAVFDADAGLSNNVSHNA